MSQLSPLRPSRCGCRCRERDGGDKPDVCKPLAVGLQRRGVARIGIQGMAIIRDLAAVGIVHQAKRARKRGRDAGQRGTQDRGPGTGAATAADGGWGVRGAIVERQPLRIREHRQRFAAHGQRSRTEGEAATAIGGDRDSLAVARCGCGGCSA
jgi:hypothetical protein